MDNLNKYNNQSLEIIVQTYINPSEDTNKGLICNEKYISQF